MPSRPPALTLRTLLAQLAASDYDSLFPETVTLQVEQKPVRVVRLSTLADLKRGATSAKDRLVLQILEDTIRSAGG